MSEATRRPPRHPLAEPPPYRDIPASVRERVEGYANDYVSKLEAYDELVSRVLELYLGRVPVPELVELRGRMDALIAGVGAMAWDLVGEGQQAVHLKRTLRSDPPDPDRAPDDRRTPQPGNPSPFARDRRARAVRSALGGDDADDLAGFHGEADPDRTPVDFARDGVTQVGRKRRH